MVRIENITLKESGGDAKERVKSAEVRKKAASETLEDGLERVLSMSLTDKERELVVIAKQAMEKGEAGRTKSGKITKGEIIDIGRRIKELREEGEKERRAKDTLDSKPDNYYILAEDKQLPCFIERVREEVRRQRKEWAGRFEMFGVQSMTAGDFEGTGIDSYLDLSIGFSIWLPILNEGYYLPYGHVSGFDVPYSFKDGDKQLTRSKVIATIAPYLSQSSEGKTFHMGAARYDLHIALNDGYRIQGCVWDTLDAMHLMNEHEESFGLKPLVQKYGKLFGIEGTVHTFEDLFGNRSPAPYNVELVGIYAINDVKYGWALFEWQFETMAKTGKLLECYAEIDSKLPETDVFMERSGFLLDVDALRDLYDEFVPKIREAEKRVYETYGIDEEFIRKMDRTLKAKDISKWIKAQEKRISRKKEQIRKKREDITKWETEGKTHLKSYQTAKEQLENYEMELTELVEPTEENAPQEVTEFSITNGNHLAYLIYDHLGIEDKTHRVKKGKKRSTAAGVLEIYYEDEPSLEPLATVAELNKLVTGYLEPFLGVNGKPLAIDADGRLHTNFKAGGTDTGRYSSSGYSGRPIEVAKEVQAIVERSRR